MLVLTRRIGEKVFIGHEFDRLTGPIVIHVLAISGNQVRYGIEAQTNLAVDREEVRARKDRGEPHRKASALVR